MTDATRTIIRELADTLRCPAEKAIDQAMFQLKSNPLLDVQLAVAASGDNGLTDWERERLLHILEVISEGRRVVGMMVRLTRHPNPRLRSRAALFVARRLDNPGWIRNFLREPDARVRANTIEGIWGIDLPATREILDRALEDKAARVAGNAVYGLMLLHDCRAVPHLQTMATSQDPAMRAAAAWVMGKANDSAWLGMLQELARDPIPKVMLMAMRSLVRLKKAGLDACKPEARVQNA